MYIYRAFALSPCTLQQIKDLMKSKENDLRSIEIMLDGCLSPDVNLDNVYWDYFENTSIAPLAEKACLIKEKILSYEDEVHRLNADLTQLRTEFNQSRKELKQEAQVRSRITIFILITYTLLPPMFALLSFEPCCCTLGRK